MQIINSVRAMQRRALAWRRGGVPVGFVPTMGSLHDGHLSLVRRARQEVGTSGQVIVSIYVNPTQFGPREDWSKYPRDLERDKQLCRKAGVDVLFVPSDDQMYPGRDRGGYSSYVVEERLSKGMEGKSRLTHFLGVTTIVAKLFNIVLPRVAVFGAKDFQQAAIIKRMVRDLDFPVKIVVAPTQREPDGLAMSSRNEYLEGDLRTQAVTLWRAIQKAKQAVLSSKKPVPAEFLKKELKKFIELQPAARVDYIEFIEPESLQPVRLVNRGTHMALAVFIGKTRLIDNARL
jgi:pantoate--beta-alanine ligase